MAKIETESGSPDVADCMLLAAIFHAPHPKIIVHSSAAPPFQTEPAPLGFDQLIAGIQPDIAAAACMKNCAPDGAQFLNVRISSSTSGAFAAAWARTGTRSAAEDEHRAERACSGCTIRSRVSRMIADLEQEARDA